MPFPLLPQRLHPTHPEPNGTVYSRYDRGYCLFFRPAPPPQTTSQRPDAAGPPPADALNLLMMHCNPSQPIILSLSPTLQSTGVHLWAGGASHTDAWQGQVSQVVDGRIFCTSSLVPGI